MIIGNLNVYGIIYKITNKINGKIYIGQTVNKKGFKGRYKFRGKGIERVYRYYEYNINKNRRFNVHLYNSIKKYGFENFEVCEIFDFAFSQEELNIKEELWIKYYNSTNNNLGYNNQNGGNNKGVNESIKRKLSNINLGFDIYMYIKIL